MLILLINSHQQMQQNKFLSFISLLKVYPNTHFGTSTLPSSGGSLKEGQSYEYSRKFLFARLLSKRHINSWTTTRGIEGSIQNHYNPNQANSACVARQHESTLKINTTSHADTEQGGSTTQQYIQVCPHSTWKYMKAYAYKYN